ncbi:FHA domain-containing protein [Cryobacterium lactosi]|uniref:FHA domain-containing protein n=1 Tax=Cryobacterium lactosi TaxID=1259202 RepID=A0A4R9BW24_9MICO|nr:FHA domain-containing protein [Cryobacterium lactosi]TFD92036.1 FHA domain-containing protein [Cryobacterium lactosi]
MDKPGFIVPPPGMFPSSDESDEVTARVPHAEPLVVVPPVRNAPAATQPEDAAPPTGPSPAVLAIPAFVPATLGTTPVPPRPPIGAVPVSAVPASAMPVSAALVSAPLGDAAPAQTVTGWQLRLADGQRMPVTGSLVFGRDPSPVTRRPSTMVSVVDPARSVSKSHALVELSAEDDLSVTDLHSTNGVSLIGADGSRVELEPGIRTPVSANTRLMLGEFAVEVTRA